MANVTGPLNVTQFGAVGNGTTNDSPAFQSALNAAVGGGAGGNIYVPPGDYAFHSTVTWPTWTGGRTHAIGIYGFHCSTRLGKANTGVGAVLGGSTIIRSHANLGSNPLFDCSPTDHSGADVFPEFNGAFDGLCFNQGAGASGKALYFNAFVGATIDNCHFSDFGANGIHIPGQAFYCRFYNNVLSNTGIQIDGPAVNGMVIDYCSFLFPSFSEPVIHMTNSFTAAQITLINSTFEVTPGPALKSACGVTNVKDCYFEGVRNGSTGGIVEVVGRGPDGRDSCSVNMDGCYYFARNNPVAGLNDRYLVHILSGGSANVTMIGNHFVQIGTGNTGAFSRFETPGGCAGTYFGNSQFLAGGIIALVNGTNPAEIFARGNKGVVGNPAGS